MLQLAIAIGVASNERWEEVIPSNTRRCIIILDNHIHQRWTVGRSSICHAIVIGDGISYLRQQRPTLLDRNPWLEQVDHVVIAIRDVIRETNGFDVTVAILMYGSGAPAGTFNVSV